MKRVLCSALIATLLYLAVLVPRASAICIPPIVELESPYNYVMSLADALGYAKGGLDHMPTQRGSSETIAEDLLMGLKLAKRDFQCARLQVVSYSASSNETIRTSASGAANAFTRLADLTDTAATAFVAALDSWSVGTFKAGSTAEGIANIGVALDDEWKRLAIAVALASHVATEPNPGTDLLRISMTRVQRDRIVGKLHSTFGDQLDEKQTLWLPFCAKMLYDFLRKPEWPLRSK